jgi:hypothetical protein
MALGPYPPDLGPTMLVHDTGTFGITFQGLALSDTAVFYASMDPGGLWTLPKTADGTAPATQLLGKDGATAGAAQPGAVALHGGMIYWIEKEYGTTGFKPGIRRIPEAGGPVDLFHETPVATFNGSLHVDATGVYFGQMGFDAMSIPPGLVRVPLDTKVAELVTKEGTGSPGVTGDGTYVYFTVTNKPEGTVMRAPVGGPPELLATLGTPHAITLDAETSTLYVASGKYVGSKYLHAIFKLPKAGGAPTPIVCNLKGVSQMLVAGPQLYFTAPDGTAASVATASNTIQTVAK